MTNFPGCGCTVNGYLLLDEIYTNAGTRVYLAQHDTYPGKFVVKCVQKDGGRVKNECYFMKVFQCRQIVKCIETFDVGDDTWIVMPFFGDGDALGYVSYAEHVVKSILYDVICGLHYMHKAGVWHRDVKPENIFVRSVSGRQEAALGDLGFAGKITQTPTEFIGTIQYCAPELVANEPCMFLLRVDPHRLRKC